jgi:hypothetical protein
MREDYMDEAEKKRLKKLGKKLVEQQSRLLREALREANPAPIGSDEWMKNYRALIARDRQLRERPPAYIPAGEARRDFVLLECEKATSFGEQPLYYQCSYCCDLLHAATLRPVVCSCGNLFLDEEALQVACRSIEQVRLVKLLARA